MFTLQQCEMCCALALYLTTCIRKMMHQLGLQVSWRPGQGDLSSRRTRHSSSSYRSIIPSRDGWLRSISMWLDSNLRPTHLTQLCNWWSWCLKDTPSSPYLQAICKRSVQCAIEPSLLHTQPNVSCWHKQPCGFLQYERRCCWKVNYLHCSQQH